MSHGPLPPGPTGIGTAAATLAETRRPARAVADLYCPTAVRTDPALAGRIQGRLDQWAGGVGLAPETVAGYGRLAVLTHPDTDDPARLTAAGQLLAVGELIETAALPAAAAPTAVTAPTAATTSAGAALAQALDSAVEEVFDACDTPGNPRRLATATDTAGIAGIGDQPALRSALAGVSALPASPYQLDRVRGACRSLAAAAPAAPAAASGTTLGDLRAPWEHLALGHVNAYTPVLTALDAIDGYELSPAAAAHPDLQRVQRLAALAAALLRDLARPAPAGLTAAIARADGLGAPAAVRRAASVHDDAMRAFHQHAAVLAAGPDPAVRRYLAGLWTWLGGHRTFHTHP
jgi:2-methylisoborneol synthase